LAEIGAVSYSIVIDLDEDRKAYLDNAPMQQDLLALPVVIPVIFWAAYHYHKDRHLPEPPLNLLIVVRFEAFDKPLDGIIYASFVGLATPQRKTSITWNT
jgi:hypothetical protein